MKRTILLFTLSLLSLSLASCNNGKKNEEASKPDPEVNVPDKPSVPETTPEEPVTPTPPTFDEDILKYNEPEDYHQIELSDTEMIHKDPKVPSDYLVYGDTYRSNDFKVTKVVNKLGYVGLYNLTLGEMIVNPQYDLDVLEDFKTPNGIFLLATKGYDSSYPEFLIFLINYGETSLVIDALGNVLYEGELLDKEKVSYVYDDYIEGFHFSPNFETTRSVSYVYDEGKLLTSEDFDVEPNYFDREKLDLSLFGLAGYIGYFDEDSAIITDLNNVEVNRYQFAFDYHEAYRYNVTLVDGYIIWQELSAVTPLDPNYNIEFSSERGILRNFKQNLLTGDVEVKEATRLIYDMEPLKDKDGLFKYVLVHSRNIENKLVVGAHETYLCDSELNLLKDYSGNPQISARRKGNYFISNKAIYDLDWNFVANYPNGIYIEYATNDGEYFVFSNNDDYYGLIDSKGYILIEPRYRVLMADDAFGYYFGCDESKLYVIDKETLKPIKEYECRPNELDLISNAGKDYKYLHVGGPTRELFLDIFTLEEIEIRNEEKGIYKRNFAYNYLDLDFIHVFDSSDNLINVVRINDPVITPYGEESTTRIEDGSSFFKPIILTKETTEINPTTLNEVKFYKYEIKTSGIYELENFDELYILNEETQSFEEIQKPGASKRIWLEGDELYFKETFDALEKYNLTIKLVSEFTPLVLEGEKTTDDKTLYRTLELTEDKYISFESESGLDVVAKKLDKMNNLVSVETVIEHGKTYYVLKAETFYIFELTPLTAEGLDYKVKENDTLEKDLFEVDNAASSYFVYEPSTNSYKSTNKASPSESNLTINIKTDGVFVFNFKVSSELKYDSLYVRLNGRELYKYNGEADGTDKITVKKGDQIVFSYRKDNSQDMGTDEAIVSAFHFEGFEEISGIEKVSS